MTGKRILLPPEGASVLAAVSGGADSIALLHMVKSLAGGRLGRIGVVHINHNLRSSAARDERFITLLCKLWGIELYVASTDVTQEAKREGIGIEEAARKLRYGFFEYIREKNGYDYILTAHTACDNTETLLLNLVRGASLAGLCGIPPERGHIMRPLLELTRDDILRYLKSKSVGYVTDETNASDDYRRNRIRHRVVPELVSENPSLHRKLIETTKHLRQDEEFIGAIAVGAYGEAAVRNGESVGFEVSALENMPEPVLRRVIRMAALELKSMIGAVHTQSVIALLGEGMSGKTVNLPGGLTARRCFGILELYRGITCERSFEIELRPYNDGETIAKGEWLARKTSGELHLRKPETGDKMAVAWRKGTKTLKKWFCELKIPLEIRKSAIVLEDDLGIVGVYGVGLAKSRAPEDGGERVIIKIKEQKGMIE